MRAKSRRRRRRRPIVEVAPDTAPVGESEPASSRADTIKAAVGDWTKQLVSLDGRNRMLYFRELTRGTLDVSPQNAGVRGSEVARLLAGEAVRLSELFDPEALADAAVRVRAIAAKARSNFEEKGLATLYIGHSFASWTRADRHTPRAPVVLLPLQIALEGPDDGDAVLQLRGAPGINPSFSYAIQQDLGSAPYPDPEDRPEDFREWLEHVDQACADLAGFSIDQRLFLANLEFTKLPMVVDMDQHFDVLLANDVVAAIAGDEEARAAINVEPDIRADLPDHVPLEDEFLVCDADVSQNFAVEAAVRGYNLVVHGPPGTGKSQTIANLISSLAARGKSILFVAEKRAAIAAVTRRLEEAGCGQLVLDLHDGSGRRHVARSLGASIEAIGPLVATKVAGPHPDLAASRKQLQAHERQMHQVRRPHGLSFFDLQAMLGTPEGEATGVRLSEEVLQKWTEPGRVTVKALLARWRNLAVRVDADPTSMWSSALIRSTDAAEGAKADVEELVGVRIPAVEDAFRSAKAELSLLDDADVPLADLADFVTTVNGLSDRYQPPFMENAENIAQALRPAERSRSRRLLAWIFDRSYRKVRRSLRDLAIGAIDPRVVLEDARRLSAAQRMWVTWAPNHPMPPDAASTAPLAIALDEYIAVRNRLVDRVPALGGVDGFSEQDRVIRAMRAHSHLADAQAQLAESARGIRDFGLGQLLRLVPAGKRRSVDLGSLAMKVFAASAIDVITWQEPELAMFDGTSHQKIAEKFADLDNRHLDTTAHRVMGRVAEQAAVVMEQQPRESALVHHEVSLKSHHMPVRQLIERAPDVVKALRPCWAMSPLLVSRMLPATHNLFDVVVFDEASQVRPVDAIPSIARAAQVVVSGDPHQLPPSRFRAGESLEDEAERNRSVDKTAKNGAKSAADAESILDVMRGLVTERKLLWHYRSQDERLINFSNVHTYERSLVTFPGTKQGTGLSHVLVEGIPDTDEGTASNPEVVRSVVGLILEHAAAHPDESLGVIATGIRHANAITEALRIARSDNDVDYGGFFEPKGTEPFFVKIMEAAQGDERDHIIFSLGYGRNPRGDLVYRWGALNRQGGERRLNVAVTRAKRRLTVVSSIAAKDIESARTRSRGAVLLTEYLDYAERGGASIPGSEGPITMTPFEISVDERLQAAGIPLQPRYGGGQLRIDFAAFASHRMERPLLAIETDGQGYHASTTVRDRDRLRHEVLDKRGWRFHRIWSTDWYRDPEAETDKVLAAWESAVRGTTDPSLIQSGRHRVERPIVVGRGRSPIRVTGQGILGYSRSELVKLVRWVQSDGIERTDAEIQLAAMEVLGLEESNHRVDRALRGAIAQAKG